MRSYVLRLVCVVFANRWLTGFTAMHTLVQDPNPTGPALDTEPGTIPANQANQLNPSPPPPPSLSPSRTNSNAPGSGLNATTGICATHTRTQRRPGPLAHEHGFPVHYPLFADTKRTREARAGPHPTQAAPAAPAGRSGRSGRSGSPRGHVSVLARRGQGPRSRAAVLRFELHVRARGRRRGAHPHPHPRVHAFPPIVARMVRGCTSTNRSQPPSGRACVPSRVPRQHAEL